MTPSVTMSDQRRQIRTAPNGFKIFVDNPTRGVDVLMPWGQHGRGCQNPTERWASPLPRRLVRAVRLDLVDSMELDRRAALKIYGNDVAAELETLIE